MKMMFKLAASAFILAAAAQPSQAALVTYIGIDGGVSSLAQMSNSVAARDAFVAATTTQLIDFEGALPGGVAVVGGGTTSLSDHGCSVNSCGFNTTAGGSFFRALYGESVTFEFTTPISAFGFFVTRLETEFASNPMVTFDDGTVRQIATPKGPGGADLGSVGAFIGFTDEGKSITKVTIDVGGDIASVDDVRFGSFGAPPPPPAAVPEPASWAMMIGGFAALGATMRRRPALLARA